jgi:hypothetical protein
MISSSPAHDHNRTDLHQVTPGLRQTATRLTWHLPTTGFTTQLPEQLGNLHQPGGSDGVAYT